MKTLKLTKHEFSMVIDSLLRARQDAAEMDNEESDYHYTYDQYTELIRKIDPENEELKL